MPRIQSRDLSAESKIELIIGILAILIAIITLLTMANVYERYRAWKRRRLDYTPIQSDVEMLPVASDPTGQSESVDHHKDASDIEDDITRMTGPDTPNAFAPGARGYPPEANHGTAFAHEHCQSRQSRQSRATRGHVPPYPSRCVRESWTAREFQRVYEESP